MRIKIKIFFFFLPVSCSLLEPILGKKNVLQFKIRIMHDRGMPLFHSNDHPTFFKKPSYIPEFDPDLEIVETHRELIKKFSMVHCSSGEIMEQVLKSSYRFKKCSLVATLQQSHIML